jgi:uncharacterized protein (UPF0335 family)
MSLQAALKKPRAKRIDEPKKDMVRDALDLYAEAKDKGDKDSAAKAFRAAVLATMTDTDVEA